MVKLNNCNPWDRESQLAVPFTPPSQSEAIPIDMACKVYTYTDFVPDVVSRQVLDGEMAYEDFRLYCCIKFKRVAKSALFPHCQSVKAQS